MVAADTGEPEINYPAWTDDRKKNGLDPPGMQNSSVDLYQRYLPGISNVTLHMRYYGLYAWLCRTYALSEPSDNPGDWKRFVRRAEALYALTAYHTGNQSGDAGIQWAGNAYEEATGDAIDIAAAADPGSKTAYLKQTRGSMVRPMAASSSRSAFSGRAQIMRSRCRAQRAATGSPGLSPRSWETWQHCSRTLSPVAW